MSFLYILTLGLRLVGDAARFAKLPYVDELNICLQIWRLFDVLRKKTVKVLRTFII